MGAPTFSGNHNTPELLPCGKERDAGEGYSRDLRFGGERRGEHGSKPVTNARRFIGGGMLAPDEWLGNSRNK